MNGACLGDCYAVAIWVKQAQRPPLARREVHWDISPAVHTYFLFSFWPGDDLALDTLIALRALHPTHRRASTPKRRAGGEGALALAMSCAPELSLGSCT